MQWSSYQNAIFNQASDMITSFHVEAKAGSGKCLGFDTKVVKFNGELEKVQNIKTGDFLMGDDGTPRKVLSVSKGFGKMYKIYPVKGDSFTCNDVHILTLTGTNSFNGAIIDIPLNEYLALCEQRPSFKKDWKLFRVGVNFQQTESVKYDPWLVGIWLAEGSVNEAHISNPDIEIWQECEKLARKIGLKITYLFSGDKCPRLSFTDSSSKHTNAFRQYVRSELFRDGEKVIPHEYLTASRDDRLRLLAGLLDGDGYYSTKGKGYEIITQYFSLCSSILFLARSLGFTANWSIKKVKLEGWVEARDYFRIVISGDCEVIPCVVKRKQAERRLQIKRHNVTGFSAVQIADDGYYGFTLDGNGRFLLEDFTVTHNTTVMTEIANQSGLGEKFLFVAFSKLIAETLKKKLPNNHCSTLHSLGYSVLRKRVPGNVRWTVDGYKYLKTLQAHLEPIQQKKGKKSNASHIQATPYQLLLQKAEDDYEHGAGLWMIAEVIGKMMVTLTPPNTNDIVNMADMYNINLPLAPDEMAEVAAKTIALGREAAFNGGFVDFNEMIYWPVMERWQAGSYHTIGVDEAQDLSNMQRGLLTLVRKERIISVADRFQSIFLFAGAACNSVDEMVNLFDMKELPLSICYRCDKEIVRHAQRLVPDIEYHADKKEGVVREIRDDKLIENLQSGAFILCRLNAPLVSKCFQLIIAGVAAKIRGKDVADQLISTIHHIAQGRTFDIGNFSYHLDHYYDLETGKIIRRGGRREKALLSMLADKVQCLQSFYDNVQPSSVYEMTDAIKALFKEDSRAKVTLMSVHRAKGLESPQVMIIEPNKLPLCFPNQSDEEMQQERNLMYVARTRAEHELIYVVKDSE